MLASIINGLSHQYVYFQPQESLIIKANTWTGSMQRNLVVKVPFPEKYIYPER